MEVGAAFSYVFDDKAWVKKVTIGGLGALLFIVVVPIFVLQGYILQTLKNVRDEFASPLPEWNNIGDLIVKGAVVSGIWLVYHLPAFFLLCPIILLGLSQNQFDQDVIETTAIIGTSLNCLFLLVFLLGHVLFPIGLIRYAHYETWRAAFQLGEVFNFIRQHTGDYLVTILLGFGVLFLSLFGAIFCIVGISVSYFLSMLVKANLYGQLARKVNI